MAEDQSSLSTAYKSYVMSLPQQTFSKGGLDREDVDYYAKESPTGRDENWKFWRNRRVKDDPLVTGYNYIFVTAPELPVDNRSPSLAGSAQSNIILSNNQRVLGLPREGSPSIYSQDIVELLSGYKSAMLPILSNRALSYTTSDEVLSTLDYSETWNRFKIVLGTTAKDSRISGSLTVNYLEDPHLTIMKLHRLWMEYVEKVFMGDCLTGRYLLDADMLNNMARTIDYMTSIYMFTVQPDGETITHWCRYTGCFPTKVPWGELSAEDGDVEIKKSIPIEYQFSYKEDMNLYVLRDFNLLTTGDLHNSPQGKFFTGGDIGELTGSRNRAYPGVVNYRINERGQRVTKDEFTGMPIFRLVFPDPSA